MVVLVGPAGRGKGVAINPGHGETTLGFLHLPGWIYTVFDHATNGELMKEKEMAALKVVVTR